MKAIENQIEVDQPRWGYVYSAYVDELLPQAKPGVVVAPPPMRPDTEMVREIERNLRRSPYVDANAVHVIGREGPVT